MEWVAVAAALVFVAYAFFGGEIISMFKNSPMNESLANVESSARGGVSVSDVTLGQGADIKSGDLVSVHYVLALQDGTVIQNSKDFGTPFQFVLGAGEVIPGFEQGVVGMKVGGVRTITIPPELGYGANQAGPIPPNSILVFTIEIVDSQALPPEPAQ